MWQCITVLLQSSKYCTVINADGDCSRRLSDTDRSEDAIGEAHLQHIVTLLMFCSIVLHYAYSTVVLGNSTYDRWTIGYSLGCCRTHVLHRVEQLGCPDFIGENALTGVSIVNGQRRVHDSAVAMIASIDTDGESTVLPQYA